MQYAVTNGSFNVQSKKLKKSGLIELFDDCFISDQIGVEKPSVEFFNHVKARIGEVSNDEILIVGDSLYHSSTLFLQEDLQMSLL